MPFSPSFTRFTADFQVLMDRIFNVLLRAGAFGPIEEFPESIKRRKPGKPTEVPPPKVIYQSRIALALRQFETAASDRLVERALNVAQLVPDAMDNIDVDVYLRQSGRNDGVSDDLLRAQQDVVAMRQGRAEAAAQQAQIDQAEQIAGAAGKVGIQAPPAA
jgi:hypothetical protein